MTYEDVRERFVDGCCMCTSSISCDECEYPIIIEALEKAEKYKWHDLRKDPYDLPKVDCMCLIKEEYYSYNKERIVEGYSLLNFLTCIGHFVGTGKMQKTLAWKYVEPFYEE